MPWAGDLLRGSTTLPASAWMEAVLDAERRGELLAAVDLASRGLDEHPSDPGLCHHAVLSLARAGSTAEAARQFEALGLAQIDSEDTAALAARLRKDEALAAGGDARRRLAAEASAAYGAVAERTGGYYPMINAATLALVAGDRQRASELARAALRLVDGDGADSYYSLATRAEALLLLGSVAAARSALRDAAAVCGGDLGALATTRRQLRLVCRLLDTDVAILAELAGPPVAHFCGHRITARDVAGRFEADQEQAVAGAVAAVLEALRFGAAYGSLASGGDILWAEALLDRGAEVHVVLPFDEEEFVAVSVAPAGAAWVRRYRSCIRRAASVTFATDDAFLGDDTLFAYCSGMAMGLALSRARFLDTEARQLALWDGEDGHGDVGTAADVGRWRSTGHPVTVVHPSGAVTDCPPSSGASAPAAGSHRNGQRLLRAMLIGDMRGYSKLNDEQIRAYPGVVVSAFAEVLERYGASVEHANTWGDALYVVCSSAPQAARCALELQERLSAVDLEAAGLPTHLGLRLSGHFGPVFALHDPILRRRTFLGAHVSRTARIEPVTPPGAVYVTEAFAAELELHLMTDVRCDYVGHLPTAKDYGRLRMYRLRRPAR